jgi:hypothetical protein
MSLAILFHFLCTQHVSYINISINRSLRLCCWITTSVVLFSVRCVLEASASACNTDSTQIQPHQISNTQRNENKTTHVVIQQHSRKFLMIDILMSETCWVHKKWNKIASDINLVFRSSRKHYISVGGEFVLEEALGLTFDRQQNEWMNVNEWTNEWKNAKHRHSPNYAIVTHRQFRRKSKWTIQTVNYTCAQARVQLKSKIEDIVTRSAAPCPTRDLYYHPAVFFGQPRVIGL